MPLPPPTKVRQAANLSSSLPNLQTSSTGHSHKSRGSPLQSNIQREPLQVIQISDLHIDREYAVGCLQISLVQINAEVLYDFWWPYD